MNLTSKYIIRPVLIISSLLLITTVIIKTFFGEKIENTVINQINNQLNNKLFLKKIDFSLLTQFPYASVDIDDLFVIEKEGFNNDTLIYSKKTYVKLSIYDLIFNEIDIKQITISEAKINIKYNYKGSPNFTIIKTNQHANNKLNIDKILIEKSNLQYITNQISAKLYMKKTLIKPLKNEFLVDANIFSKKFIVNKINYIENKHVDINTPVYIKEDSIIFQKPSEINIEGVLIKPFGKIINNNYIDINFSCESQKIEDIIKHTPEHLKAIYTSFDANGLLSCNGNIKGYTNKIRNPKLNVIYSVKKGSLQIKESLFNLQEISLSGNISNGNDNNFFTTEINANQFNAQTKNGTINGQFKLSNLNNYYLNTTFNSTWDLKEINKYFKSFQLPELNGKIIVETKYIGHISFDNSFATKFIRGDHLSKSKFENVTFQYNNLNYNIKEIECLFNNKIIDIYKSDLTIADSDLRFKGKIVNLIDNLITKKDSIIINGDLESTYINDELIYANESKNSTANTSDWIDLKLNSNISNLSYNQFIASNIRGKINYKNLTLTGKSVAFNSLNGNVISDFKFYKSKNNSYKLFTQTDFEKLNIQITFMTFNNFNQDFITSEHIKGEASAQIQMQASWDDKFNFIAKDLSLKSYLIIEKGELIDLNLLKIFLTL